jgi:hypothetical protein
MRQKGINETRNRDFKEQLQLGSERTTSEFNRKAYGLEFIKKATVTMKPSIPSLSPSQHVSASINHHQVFIVLLKLLYCTEYQLFTPHA